MAPPPKPRNLLRLAGVINSVNAEADREAGELIERIKRNGARTLDLVTKGHKNEGLREQMLSEAEKEQALADLEAAVGDNGGPLLQEELDPAQEAIRASLKAAKSGSGSRSSEKPVERPAEKQVVTAAEVGNVADVLPQGQQSPFLKIGHVTAEPDILPEVGQDASQTFRAAE